MSRSADARVRLAPTGVYAAHADVAGPGRLTLTVFVSTDPGPAREYCPYLEVALDEAHGSELLGTLALAMRDLREQRTGRVGR